MAESAAGGGMDIHDQRSTFSGFLTATVWTSALIAQAVALLTLAFAIGAGWWPGLIALVLIGVVTGLVFKMSGVWWAVQVSTWVLLGLGGMIVPAFVGLMS
ncbi:MAG: aa3-type cytochrome c oxidase subunit IV [Hyphomonadaceae bacterium]